MTENLQIYNTVKDVPDTALKEIKAGRLKGMSDINPMWRIKTLTEQFGPCGIGWKYEIVNKELVTGGKDEIAAMVDINLYIKDGDKWSDAIPGTGGSMFVANQKNGPYVSDECYKMALTDAISVACKMLGFAANVYWDKDKTKYNEDFDATFTQEDGAWIDAQQPEPEPVKTGKGFISTKQAGRLFAKAGYEKGNDVAVDRSKKIVQEILDELGIKTTGEIKKEEYDEICEQAEVKLAECFPPPAGPDVGDGENMPGQA